MAKWTAGIIWLLTASLGFCSDDPGALDGKFSVSPAGSADYVVPIKCPPGTAGMQPAISLSYDSQGSIGSLGIGWSIGGLSIVTRGLKNPKTDGSLGGIHFDKDDALFLDGARLIPYRHGDSSGEIEYKTEIDSYSKIVASQIGAEGPTQITVWTKAGLRMEYGFTENSRIRRQDKKILVWACERIVDTFGNYIGFSYENNGKGDYNVDEISYTCNDGANLKPYASIKFAYENVTASTGSYVLGLPIIKDRRLTTITSFFGTRVMTEYHLSYENTDSAARFRLKAIQEFGGDGRSFPPTGFTYSDSDAGWIPQANFQLPVALATSNIVGRGIRYADLNGDGQVVLLYGATVNGKLDRQAYINGGNGWEKRDVLSPPIAFASETTVEHGIRFIDINGDGKLDLVYSSAVGGVNKKGTWLNTDSGWIPSKPEFEIPVPLAIDGVPNDAVRFADLKGDGTLGVIWSRRLADGTVDKGAYIPTKQGWKKMEGFEPPQPISLGSNTGGGVYLIDTNCDGHRDLVYHRLLPNGEVQQLVYLWTASGWSATTDSRFVLPFKPLANPAAVKIADLEGNGHDDVMVSWSGVSGNVSETYLSTKDGWTKSTLYAPPSAFAFGDNEDAFVQVCDLSGHGQRDLICYTIRPGGVAYKFAYVSDEKKGWLLRDELVPPLPMAENGKRNLVYLLDFDGDKRADLAYNSGSGIASTGPVVYLNREDQGWQLSRDFSPPEHIAQQDKYDLGVRFVDAAGHGRSDLLCGYRSADGSETKSAYLNTGAGWQKADEFILPTDVVSEKDGDLGVRFIDLNGDGLPDCLIGSLKADGSPQQIQAWRNAGSQSGGAVGTAWVTDSSLVPPSALVKENYGDLGARFIDLTGRGLPDLILGRFDSNDVAASAALVSSAWRNMGAPSGGTVWQTQNAYAPPIEFVQSYIYMPPDKEGGWSLPPDVDLMQVSPPRSRDCSVLTVDLNGDGLPDLAFNFVRKGIHIQPIQIKIPIRGLVTIANVVTRTKQVEKGAYLNTGSGWTAAPDRFIPPRRLDEGGEDNPKLYVQSLDVNGDGQIDLLFIEKGPKGEDKCETYLNTGDGWSGPSAEWKVPLDIIGPGEGDPGFRFIDINGDGLPDIIFYKIAKDGSFNKGAYINTGQGWKRDDRFAPISPLAQEGQQDLGVRTFDLNGDGLPDLIHSYTKSDGSVDKGVLLNKSRRRDVLTDITDGLGMQYHIKYEPLGGASIIVDPVTGKELPAYEAPPLGVYPTVRAVPPAYVVGRVQVRESVDRVQDFTYRYGNFRYDANARRPLGFEWVEIVNETTGTLEHTTFDQLEYALIGQSKSVETYLAVSGARKRHLSTENSWRVEQQQGLNRADGSPYTIYSIFLDRTKTVTSDLDGTPIASEESSFSFDGYGNAEKVVVSRSDGSRAETVSTFLNDETKWFLGRLRESIVRLVDGNGATITRRAKFDYDSLSGILTKQISLVGTPEALTVEHSHDRFGNEISTLSRASGVTSRITREVYDELGRFPIKKINGLGQTTHLEYDSLFGTTSKVEDPNGIYIRSQYDSHGRLSSTTSVTGIPTIIKYEWLAASGLNEKYATTISTAGLPSTSTWFDIKGRPVREIKVGGDGRRIFVDSKYDNLGRTTLVSNPYFEGEQAYYTQILNYDALNRPRLVITPDGHRTTYIYSGFKTTTIDPLGRTTESETNIRKLPIRLKDAAGGVLEYTYDPEDHVTRIKAADGTTVVHKYNLVGKEIEVQDPDLGDWQYAYNPFGQLVWQRDAKGQESRIAYDRLGRPIRQEDADRTVVFEYDTAPHGVGAISSISTSDGYGESYSYDRYGRRIENAVTVAKERFATKMDLDAYGRISFLTYPDGLVVTNHYNVWGYMDEVSSPNEGVSYWKAGTFNERGHVAKEKLGNGTRTAFVSSKKTGLLKEILTQDDEGNAIQDLKYTYNAVNNISGVEDPVDKLDQEFRYDDLDRLKEVVCSDHRTLAMRYGATGNILEKSDVGSFDYTGDVGPVHGVKRIHAPSGGISEYKYDANGNAISIPGGVLEYTAANQVRVIEYESAHSVFKYSPGGERYFHDFRDGLRSITALSTGLYERIQESMTPPLFPNRDLMIGWEYNETNDNHAPLWRRQILAGQRIRQRHYVCNQFGVVAIVESVKEVFPNVSLGSGVANLKWDDRVPYRVSRAVAYLHTDLVGSVQLITDQSGRVIERLRYDVWGKRLEQEKRPAYHTYKRGFIGQEHLDVCGLVHLNGRIYDPTIGRFLSPDPFMDSAAATAAYNRFAYAANDPLRFIDPSGYGIFGDIGNFFSGVGHAISDAANWVANGIKDAANWVWNGVVSVGKWIGENWKDIVIAVAAVVITVVSVGTLGPVVAGCLAGFVAGGLQSALYGGSISDILEGAFKGAVFGAISGGAFEAVGAAAQSWGTSGWAYAGHAAAHAVVGGGLTAMEGGNFWTGALSAGVSQAGSIGINDIEGFSGDYTVRITATAVLGGTTSVIGGGKFGNGALVAAFGRAFNDELHPPLSGDGKLIEEKPLERSYPEFLLLGAYDLAASAVEVGTSFFEIATDETLESSESIGWSEYLDVTKGDSVRNIVTDVAPEEFSANLRDSGFTSVETGPGTMFTGPQGQRYFVRPQSDSFGPTADHYLPGSQSINTKIRLGIP